MACFIPKIFGIGNVKEACGMKIVFKDSKMNEINEKINEKKKFPKYFSKVLCPCYQNSLPALSY